MWKKLIKSLGAGCEFLSPAKINNIRELEDKLSITLPTELKDLLLKSNGIWGPSGEGLIWTIERILRDNLEFQSNPDFKKLYMPFDHLLFFGDDGSGDQFAFRILAGEINDQGVFRWCHENDAREWYAGGLRDYLARSLGHDSYFSIVH